MPAKKTTTSTSDNFIKIKLSGDFPMLLRFRRPYLAAHLALGLMTGSVYAGGNVPDEVMNYFTSKPILSSKNNQTTLPQGYDISKALREDHVAKMFEDSRDKVEAL